MRILVIDDSKWNQDSARETLADHDLVVCGDVTSAYEALGERDPSKEEMPIFGAVFTDLWMPTPKDDRGSFLGEPLDYRDTLVRPRSDEMPAGLCFALMAKNRGVRHVVICTDGNHHTDRLTSMLDALERTSDPNMIRKIEARYVPVRRNKKEVRWDIVGGKEVIQEEIGYHESDEPRYRVIKDWGRVLIECLKA